MTSVLVLLGGPDAEREVSLTSGRDVAEALRQAGHRVHEEVIHYIDAAKLARLPGDVIFPVLHGPWGEGGGLQIELEADGRPFVGAASAAAALCMDKDLVKRLARASGLDTPDWTLIENEADLDHEHAQPPVVVKPVDEGSSVGLHLCESRVHVEEAVSALRSQNRRVLVERLVIGRELTVGLFEGAPLPVVEIEVGGSSYDWAAKYDRSDTAYVVEPRLDEQVRDSLQSIARKMGELCSVRDLARVDFLLDDAGTPWLLEVNTMPGFTGQSLFPKAARAIGLTMEQLCARLVEAARRRGRETAQAPPR